METSPASPTHAQAADEGVGVGHALGFSQRPGDLPRAMRAVLVTDTLADVNGVSRFIRDVGRHAQMLGRSLTIITSTRLACPEAPNIINVAPRLATRMPKYEHLEVVTPPVRRVRALLARLDPDVVHISTPGPVGGAGLLAARALRRPTLGVYHTDFPAYVDHLMDDRVLTWTTTAFMRWFYGSFAGIFTRSADYAQALRALGVPCSKIRRLRPGTDIAQWHPRWKREGFWASYPGLRASSVKAIFVGRVSVEKNMPLLARVWAQAAALLARRGVDAQLLVVGDGPYRARMEAELAHARARDGGAAQFLGFRYGDELAAIYANSDLFVFPSTTDTLGQVVMEAQASGLGVLVSDQGGPREVVGEGRTGLVLPAARPERWVAALAELLADSPRLRTMGAAAHASMQSCSIRDSFEHFWSVHEHAWRDALIRRGTLRVSEHERARLARRDGYACPPLTDRA